MDPDKTPGGGRVKRPRRNKIFEQLRMPLAASAGAAIAVLQVLGIVPISPQGLSKVWADNFPPYCSTMAPTATFDYSWIPGEFARAEYEAGKQMFIMYNTDDSTWEMHVMQGAVVSMDQGIGHGNLGDVLRNTDTDTDPTATDFAAYAFQSDGTLMSTGEDTGGMGPGVNFVAMHHVQNSWCIYMVHGVTFPSEWLSRYGAPTLTTVPGWTSPSDSGGGGDDDPGDGGGGGDEGTPLDTDHQVTFTDTTAKELAAYIHVLAVKGAAGAITLALALFFLKPFVWRSRDG